MARNFLEINNDCLMEIFVNLYLRELSDAASTCARFQTVARDVFSLRHKSICLDIDINSMPCRLQATAILQHFGDLITKVEVTFWCQKERNIYNISMLNLMTKYCTGELARLKLFHCKYLQADEMIDTRALFRNVKELILDDSAAIDASFLSDAQKLTRFTLKWFYFADAVKFLANDYPKLEALTLSYPKQRNNIDIIGFLKRHPGVTGLELRRGYYDLSSIDECAWLRTLTIWDCDECDLSPIAQLDHLTALKLSIDYFDQSTTQLLMTTKSSLSLEELVLSGFAHGNGTEFMTALQRFTNLKNLSFRIFAKPYDGLLGYFHCLKALRALSIAGTEVSITGDGLVDLVGHLPHLEQLSVHLVSCVNYFQLKVSTYLRICEIYRHRNRKLTIFNFDISNANSNYDCNETRRKELFAEAGQRNFVQYITADHADARTNVIEI